MNVVRHDVGHSLCWCVWVPVRWSLCLFWRETHTKSRGEEGPREAREIEEGLRRGQSGDESRAERRPVNRCQKVAARTCWPTDARWPMREAKSALLVTPCMVTIVSVLYIFFFYICNLLWINDKGKEGRSVIRCWAFVVLVCVGASQTIPLSVLARNPHKGPVRETGSRRGKEGPKEARKTVRRKSKEMTVRRWESSREEASQQMSESSCKDLLTYRCQVTNARS